MLVATYGGFSYLGPFLGIPTCAFYSTRRLQSIPPISTYCGSPSRAKLTRQSDMGPGYVALDTGHFALLDQLARQPLQSFTARS